MKKCRQLLVFVYFSINIITTSMDASTPKTSLLYVGDIPIHTISYSSQTVSLTYIGDVKEKTELINQIQAFLNANIGKSWTYVENDPVSNMTFQGMYLLTFNNTSNPAAEDLIFSVKTSEEPDSDIINVTFSESIIPNFNIHIKSFIQDNLPPRELVTDSQVESFMYTRKAFFINLKPENNVFVSVDNFKEALGKDWTLDQSSSWTGKRNGVTSTAFVSFDIKNPIATVAFSCGDRKNDLLYSISYLIRDEHHFYLLICKALESLSNCKR